MRLFFAIFTLAVCLSLGPAMRQSAAEDASGISIYSKPGAYAPDKDATPTEWTIESQTVINPRQGRIGKLSKPFPEKNETDIFVAGNAVLVPVRLGYGRKEVSVLLIFDTGATTTTLFGSVGEKLGLDYTDAGRISIADGTVIEAQKAVLDYIIIGPYRMDGFQAFVIDHNNDSSKNAVKGLLGMNFLRKVNYHIDFAQKKIRWSDK